VKERGVVTPHSNLSLQDEPTRGEKREGKNKIFVISLSGFFTYHAMDKV
jgi:hypothetical protein